MFRVGLILIVAASLVAGTVIPSQPEQPRPQQAGGGQGYTGGHYSPTPNYLVPAHINRPANALQQTTANKEEEHFAPRWAWLSLTNFWIAVFAVILTLVTAGQWGITFKQLRLARKEFKTDQRAFVYVDGFEPSLSLIDDSESGRKVKLKTHSNRALFVTRFAFQPIWKNSGKTPTRNMRISVDWRAVDAAHHVGTYRAEDAIQFFVAPQSTALGEIIETGGSIGLLIQDGNVDPSMPPPPILVWGRADYEDIFGATHFCEWCYRLQPSRPVESQRLTVSFIQWPEYNHTEKG